jgi:hypothetical protein
MQLETGMRLRCATCTTEVIVIRVPPHKVNVEQLQCGGQPMVARDDPLDSPFAVHANGDGAQLGKRYQDDEDGLEILCTKSGAGTLSCDDKQLMLKQPKVLPSSD